MLLDFCIISFNFCVSDFLGLRDLGSVGLAGACILSFGGVGAVARIFTGDTERDRACLTSSMSPAKDSCPSAGCSPHEAVASHDDARQERVDY